MVIPENISDTEPSVFHLYPKDSAVDKLDFLPNEHQNHIIEKLKGHRFLYQLHNKSTLAQVSCLDDDENLHRIDGPAVYTWDMKGYLKSKAHFINNDLHNENGPAIFAHICGHYCNWYYLEGQFYTKKAYEKEMIDRRKDGLGRVFL